MKIKFNSTFKSPLDKYNLPADLNLNVDLPLDVQQMLSNTILVNEFGIGLETNWEPYLVGTPEEQSFHEDDDDDGCSTIVYYLPGKRYLDPSRSQHLRHTV